MCSAHYHSGFQFGVACALIDVIPNLRDKERDFQKGFTAGFGVAEHCIELRVCSRVGFKEFVKPKYRERRFKHEPRIEGKPFYC